MSLPNIETHNPVQPLAHHPWERRIKAQYAAKIKYAHNSINNPAYPKKNEKEPDKHRARFTIIGNRVTKEFIYCVNLLKGLHKCRWRNFSAPVIRGVTSVEWPQVWNDLKLRFGSPAYCLSSQCAVLLNDEFLGGEDELKKLIKTKYSYHICPDYQTECVNQFASFIKASGRPCAYMHFSINKTHIGTMIFMLYADLLPNTSENFLRLCKSKKGGYGGTPVHRIVKDGWIQCGGFGLKSTNLSCENFIVPHDRRGVLCMANDGRHLDCSTQFFVLLQPAPWMAHKYVAFGQLVEGEGTLQKIENEPTWYESPTSEIIIDSAGIFNMECQDIPINKGTVEYIEGHIEDLVALQNLFCEMIMDKVFTEIEGRRIAALAAQAEGDDLADDAASVRATQRFIRNKEDMEKQLEKTGVDDRKSVSRPPLAQDNENNDFDVEVFDYEPEEYSYQHVSLAASPIPIPRKPYYLALTDVPYPGEIDSTHDLKKFLRGDYCLESDLLKCKPKKYAKPSSIPSEIFNVSDEDSGPHSEESLDSQEEKEIRRYLKLNVDRVSFAGDVIKGIAKGTGKLNIFEGTRKSELATDEDLRKTKVTSAEYRRRSKKVRIAPTSGGGKTLRRPTGFVRAAPEDSDTQVMRQSVLTRLYDDITGDDHDTVMGPTLKDYKPMSETQHRNLLLITFSPNLAIKSEENTREKYLRHSVTVEDDTYENVLNLQHGKQVARKISSDYVNTIDQIEHKLENSIRSIEFARMRPAISVTEYQMKNQKHINEMKRASKSQVKTVMHPAPNFG